MVLTSSGVAREEGQSRTGVRPTETRAMFTAQRLHSVKVLKYMSISLNIRALNRVCLFVCLFVLALKVKRGVAREEGHIRCTSVPS